MKLFPGEKKNFIEESIPNRRLGSLSILVLISLLLLAHLLVPYARRAIAAPNLQEATSSPTSTLSPTLSQTVTLEETPTATASPTADLLASISPSVTASATATQNQLQSSTPTLGITGTLMPSLTPQPSTTETVFQTPATMTATATYLPLPTITMLYPKLTPTAYLMSSYRSADSVQKQRFPLLIRVLARFWPLTMLFLIWVGLIAWFTAVQIRGDK